MTEGFAGFVGVALFIASAAGQSSGAVMTAPSLDPTTMRAAERPASPSYHDAVTESMAGAFWSAEGPGGQAVRILGRRLMGERVLDPGKPTSQGLRVYAHCLRETHDGVALLVINNTDQEAALHLPAATNRYTVAAAAQPNAVMLNGRLVRLDGGDRLPLAAGLATRIGTVRFPPATATFLALPFARNAVCQ